LCRRFNSAPSHHFNNLQYSQAFESDYRLEIGSETYAFKTRLDHFWATSPVAKAAVCYLKWAQLPIQQLTIESAI